MSDLIRRDDLLDLYKVKEEYKNYSVPLPVIIQNIKDMLVVDAVEVVRCKDCKYFMAYRCEIEGRHGDCYVRLVNSYEDQFVSVANNEFCSYGERREKNAVD